MNGFFVRREGILNKPIFKSSNTQGLPGGGGGMLKYRFDWYIMQDVLKLQMTCACRIK